MKEKFEELIADYLIICWIIGIYFCTIKVFETIFLGISKFVNYICDNKKNKKEITETKEGLD